MSTLSVNTISATSGGTIAVNANVKISGSTELSGNVIVGNAGTDTIKFNSLVSSSLVPHTNNVFDLGSSAKKWKDIYVTTLNVPSVINTGGQMLVSGSTTGSCGSGNESILLKGRTHVKGCMYVSGTAEVLSGLTVGGNLTVNGTTTTFNSTTVTVDDPIITLGGDSNPGSDDNKDRGVEFRWHNGSTHKRGFFGFDDSSGLMTFIPDATNSSEVFSGTVGSLDVAGIDTIGDITFDASGGDIYFKKDGVTGLHFSTEHKRLGINSPSPTHTLEVEGNAFIGSTLDINGNELILDADADTSITADTDDTIDFKVAGSDRFSITSAAITPTTDNTISLGSASKRFANIYTNDLHLANERGDWTIVEEEEYLSIRNNKSGKLFKFVLQEIK